MIEEIIKNLSEYWVILEEKKRIAHNLKRCLQQFNDSAAASSASCSSYNYDTSDAIREINEHLVQLSNAVKHLKGKLAILRIINKLDKADPDKINEKTFNSYLDELKALDGKKKLALTFSDFLHAKQNKGSDIWNHFIAEINSEFEKLKTSLQNAADSECPHYFDTRDNSGDLIEKIIENINVILSNNASLSEECKGHIQTLLQSYKNNKDYISFQQATALWVLLRQLDEGVKLVEEDKRAFRLMLIQCPWDKREGLFESLRKLSQLKADTSGPYYSAIVSGVQNALLLLLIFSLCALIVAGTVLLGIKGFTTHTHERVYYMVFFVCLTFTMIAPISAIGGLLSIIGLIHLPFVKKDMFQDECQKNQSELEDYRNDIKITLKQVEEYQERYPDFHNDNMIYLINIGKQTKIQKSQYSSKLFQGEKECFAPEMESIDIARKVDREIQIIYIDKIKQDRAEINQDKANLAVSEFLSR